MTRIITIGLLALTLTAGYADAATSRARFTVRVAAVAERSSAEALAEEIPGAWIQEVRRAGATLYRVNVRRLDDRSEAIQLQWDLDDLGYDSVIQELYDRSSTEETRS